MFRQFDDHHQVERDVIMRQIKQLMQLVARLMGAASTVKRDVALDELRRATGDLLRLDMMRLDMVDARSAADLLRRSERIELYAHSVLGQAQLHGRDRDAAAQKSAQRRALQLFIEAALRGSLDGESTAIVRKLTTQVDASTLAARYTDWLGKLA
jgi:hypothetical protein